MCHTVRKSSALQLNNVVTHLMCRTGMIFGGDVLVHFRSPLPKGGWPAAAILKIIWLRNKALQYMRGRIMDTLAADCGDSAFWMKLHDKLHCRPKHTSPRCFWLVFISAILPPLFPSSSPDWVAPELDPVNGLERMPVPVWSATLLSRELPLGGGVGVGVKKKKKRRKEKRIYLGRKPNSNSLWHTDTNVFLPAVTQFWSSNLYPWERSRCRSRRLFEELF